MSHQHFLFQTGTRVPGTCQKTKKYNDVKCK